jgi:glycosyltransferase involved in cell wall biosynthesis
MEALSTMSSVEPSPAREEVPKLDLSVVVPVRNAERLIDECLTSIVRSGAREIIVVDGMSTDGTLEIAKRYPVRVLSDDGRGLPVARLVGVQAAKSRFVALIDADVVLPDGALEQLFEEFSEDGYAALQAGLHSVSGPGYWGQALAHHHRSGRSKDWFGVVATIFERDALLEHGFDERFLSGEDIELRWRLEREGARVGVSSRTVVTHRFAEDTFEFAKGQWLADGRGLGRMVRKHGLRAAWLFGLPLAATVRGILLSLARLQPRWIPYYLAYMVFNYVGMVGGVGARPRNGGQT